MTTNNNFYKSFFKYISFSVLGMIGLSFYVLVDTIFIANGIGHTGLTALSIALPVYIFINGLALMFAVGGSTLFSIYSSNNLTSANKVFSQTIITAICLGIIFTLCNFFSQPIATFLGAKELINMPTIYIKIVLIFAPAFFVNQQLLYFIRNDNNPRLPMIAMIASSLTNIVLDYLLIFVFPLGMFGAALATSISPVISVCILLFHFRKSNNHKLHFSFIAPTLKFLKKVIYVGGASFVTELSSGVVMALFNIVIYKVGGSISVAAYSIIANVALIVIAIYNGIAQGTQPLISNYYSTSNYKLIKKTYLLSLLICITLGVTIYILGINFDYAIINVFNQSNNQELFNITQTGIHIYFLSFIFVGVNISTMSLLSSMRIGNLSFLISVSRGFIFIIPTLLLFSNFGIKGVWFTTPFVELITSVLCILIVIYVRTTIANKQA